MVDKMQENDLIILLGSIALSALIIIIYKNLNKKFNIATQIYYFFGLTILLIFFLEDFHFLFEPDSLGLYILIYTISYILFNYFVVQKYDIFDLKPIRLCFNCYAENKLVDLFCYYCGKELSEENDIKKYEKGKFKIRNYRNLLFKVDKLTDSQLTSFDAIDLDQEQIEYELNRISETLEGIYSERDISKLKEGFKEYIKKNKYGYVLSYQRENSPKRDV